MNYFRVTALAVIGSITLLCTSVVAQASVQTADVARTTEAASAIGPGGSSNPASMTKAERKAARKVARAKKNSELKRLEAAGYRPGGYNPDYPETAQSAGKKAGAAASSP